MKPKYVIEDVDRHGNVRLYVRKKGRPKIRLHHEPGTPEFIEEHRLALEGLKAPAPPTAEKLPKPGSFRWAFLEYCKRAGQWKRLSDVSKSKRKSAFDKLFETHGTNPIALMESHHVQAIIDERSDTPFAANNLLKWLRQFFRWCKKNKYVTNNPAEDADKFEVETSGHITWTIEDILRFMKRHPAKSKAGLAFALLFYLGPRRSDVVLLGRQMETRDGGIRWWEYKGRNKKPKLTETEIIPELRSVLDMHNTGNRLTYLVTEFGKPFSAPGFGNKFRQWCDEAELFEHSAHGVRKGSSSWASEQGATANQLQAMYNWCDLQQPSLYTAAANKKKLARSGAKLLSLQDHLENETVPLSGWDTKRRGPTD